MSPYSFYPPYPPLDLYEHASICQGIKSGAPYRDSSWRSTPLPNGPSNPMSAEIIRHEAYAAIWYALTTRLYDAYRRTSAGLYGKSDNSPLPPESNNRREPSIYNLYMQGAEISIFICDFSRKSKSKENVQLRFGYAVVLLPIQNFQYTFSSFQQSLRILHP